jgi:hypothetical protein
MNAPIFEAAAFVSRRKSARSAEHTSTRFWPRHRTRRRIPLRPRCTNVPSTVDRLDSHFRTTHCSDIEPYTPPKLSPETDGCDLQEAAVKVVLPEMKRYPMKGTIWIPHRV